MSDAKSRYEIIDELTDKKLQMINEIAAKNTNLISNDASIVRQERVNVRQIEDMKENNVVNAEAVEKQKEDLQRKIDAVDDAVIAIKAISANNEKAKGSQ